jgi:hypothetical protein
MKKLKNNVTLYCKLLNAMRNEKQFNIKVEKNQVLNNYIRESAISLEDDHTTWQGFDNVQKIYFTDIYQGLIGYNANNHKVQVIENASGEIITTLQDV